jgi:hypothetical protein
LLLLALLAAAYRAVLVLCQATLDLDSRSRMRLV